MTVSTASSEPTEPTDKSPQGKEEEEPTDLPGEITAKYRGGPPLLKKEEEENLPEAVEPVEPPPKDRWCLTYLTLLFQGVAILMAWNMFITAKYYFVNYKLVDSRYAGSFLAYLGLASNIPNVCFSWMNVFLHVGGDLTIRIVWSLTIEVLIFLFTVALAMVDSSQWPAAFFWLTMVSVFFLCGFNAIYQNCVFGVASCLPAQYTGVIILGSEVCGILVVLLGWASDEIGGNQRTSAIYYFINGMFVLILCVDTYLALPLNKFYRYHSTKQRQLHQNQVASYKTPYGNIFKQASIQLYNIWGVYFVTIAVFPAVISDIQSESGLFGDNFMRITCFLTFNVTALIGSITASLLHFPEHRWLWIFTTLRLVFIPFFLLCNYRPKSKGQFIVRKIPVLITNDWVYWVGSMLLGWSAGHGSTLGLMYVSRTVSPEHGQTAAMMGSAMLMTGIISGVGFSFLAPKIV